MLQAARLSVQNANGRVLSSVLTKAAPVTSIRHKSEDVKISGKVIGIDLGTTNSCVSIMEGKTPKIIEVAGARTVPSVVAFTKDAVLVGKEARNQAITNPQNTFYAIKRLIGRKYDDQEVINDKTVLSYSIVSAPNGDAWVEAHGKQYSTEQISAFILQKLKTAAESYLNEPVKDAVITVPAYFNDFQRQATKDAGQIAGLNVIRVVNEPTAAALSYGLKNFENKTIAVYDLGGGTFDVSVLKNEDGVLEVKSSNGDTHLGGEDFDNALLKFLVDKIKNEHGIDVTTDAQAVQRLREAVEKTKILLDGRISVDINLPFLFNKGGSSVNFFLNLTKYEYERLVDPLVNRTVTPCKKALKDAKVDKGDIKDVLLVGGMTKMPKIQKIVQDIFGMAPNCSLDHDLSVSMGAATVAGVMAGSVSDVLLQDVIPISLGVRVKGGVFNKLINRNTTIPTRKSEAFTTIADGQTSILFKVYQGEREIAADNKFIGQFQFDGLPPAPKGVAQIDLTTDIDANGIVQVTARDRATGQEQKLVIKSNGGLNKDQIEDMIRNAEKHAEEDKLRREHIDTVKNSQSIIGGTETNMEKFKNQIPNEEYVRMKADAMKIKKMIDNPDETTHNIKKATSDFQQASLKLFEVVYKKMETDMNNRGRAKEPKIN